MKSCLYLIPIYFIKNKFPRIILVCVDIPFCKKIPPATLKSGYPIFRYNYNSNHVLKYFYIGIFLYAFKFMYL